MKTLGVRLESNGLHWTAAWGTGKGRKRQTLGSKARLSKREALGKCRELAAKHLINPGARDAGKAPALGVWLDELARLRTDLAEGTVLLFKNTGDYLKEHYGAETRLDRITKLAAAGFKPFVGAKKNRAGESIAEATVNAHIARARLIFGEAKDKDLISFNPFESVACSPPQMERDWHYVSEADLEKAMVECSNDAWRCMLALCRLAGLRRSEARALKWQDIKWSAPATLTIKPRRNKRTTKEHTRIVPIVARLYEILNKTFIDCHDATFGPCDGVGSNNIERNTRAIMARAGLPDYKKPLHTLRKNLVTDWQTKYPPLDVAAWLGHDVKVAAQHYHQTKPETLAMVTGGILATVDSEKHNQQRGQPALD